MGVRHHWGMEDCLWNPVSCMAWHRTLELAEALQAEAIVFQTPRSFLPTSDNLCHLHRFFEAIDRQVDGWRNPDLAMHMIVGMLSRFSWVISHNSQSVRCLISAMNPAPFESDLSRHPAR